MRNCRITAAIGRPQSYPDGENIYSSYLCKCRGHMRYCIKQNSLLSIRILLSSIYINESINISFFFNNRMNKLCSSLKTSADSNVLNT